MWFVMFFFKKKTAYEMRISDWSSDVCSSDLRDLGDRLQYVRIGAAAADIAAHPLANFHIRRLGRRGQVAGDVAGDSRLDLFEHRDRRADLPRRAIAALKISRA